MSEDELPEVGSVLEPRKNAEKKRSVSERKLRANRNNALRSTGPKTAQGKHNASRNAIKDGILAREIVIADGDGKESLEEFSAFLKELEEYYRPSGIVEKMLVQRIAASWWKLARALRAENGEIRMRLDTIGRDRARRSSDSNNLVRLLVSKDPESYPGTTNVGKMSGRDPESADQGTHIDLRSHQSGIEYLRAILLNAKAEIARDGYLSKETQRRIYFAFCGWDYWFAASIDRFCPPQTKRPRPISDEVEENPSSSKGGEEDTTIEERAEIIAMMDDRLQKVYLLEQSVAAREKLETDAVTLSFSLPAEDATDKLLRYGSLVDRQLYRAMDQLERVQRQRKGENVLPPININLARRA